MKLTLYQVDAFTKKVFGGNPAAVCPLEQWIDDSLMQQIAAENNLSETAFFVTSGDHYEIRWFTPETEVDLCGHATLASAHVLFRHLGVNSTSLHFVSRHSGHLYVSMENDRIILDFPASRNERAEIPGALARGLGKEPLELYRARDYMAVFNREEDVIAMRPDHSKLKDLDVLGIIVTAPGNECDFVSRFFAPAAGITEDPVTGSAHTMLIPYWSTRLDKKILHAIQISERRGELFCEMKHNRVAIGGYARTYLIGQIEI